MRFIARAPHYRRAERLLLRRSGGVARLPASGLTPCSMSSPMSIDLDCPRKGEVLSVNRMTMRSIARTPHYRRGECLLRRRSGGVARLPCRQRHPD
jgi:hypothetical protein